MPTSAPEHLPSPRSERHHLIAALALLALGVALLGSVLGGAWSGLGRRAAQAPPPVVVVAPTPQPGAAPATISSRPGAIVAQPPPSAAPVPAGTASAHVLASWEQGFYPLYETASRTFGVNWLLLASIHKQETAFSTAPSTYHGLNFAGCCGGPMQFNVSNRPITTWSLVRAAYRFAPRPSWYNHPTAGHPSIYDDFDAIMAAGWLLYSDGAGAALDDGAWNAAYDYYGHDADGVTYADDVVARAISWSQHGFCINCGLDTAMVAAVHAAYGAPVLASLEAAAAHHAARAAKPHRARRH